MGTGERAGRVEFRILGPLEVACDGRPLAVKPAKARALLALLLIAPGRIATADRLIDELWGDRPPASAAVSLRVLVSRLRETLTTAGLPDAIATRSPGYALQIASGDVDAQRFETLVARGRDELAGGDAQLAAGTLRDALALWRGPALADVADSSATAAEAARLDEAHLLALEERIDADLACGRHTAVVAELESLVRAHPLRERVWAARMLALYRCGRQADALAAFTELRGHLVAELGIEPSPDLRDLQQRVLDHDPELSLAPRAASRLTGAPTGVVTFMLTDIEGSSRLWERDPDAMRRALRRHEEIVAAAVRHARGVLVKSKGEGDSSFSVFARASDAIRAAQAVQAAHRTEPWPDGGELRLRTALHTGEAHERDGDYLGTPVNRAARLRSLAQPGQIVLSQTTAEIVGDQLPEETLLVDLGRRGLRGHERDERVFELRAVGNAPRATAEEYVRELPADLIGRGVGAFVGRKSELDVLGQLWQGALAGTQQVALLAGEPGIGKTRLAAELAARAYDDGAVVLFGRCDEDLGVPYQPFAEALRVFVEACPVTELADHAGRDAGDLALLVPEVGERLLGARPATTVTPQDARDRLFSAVVSLLAGASRQRPLVLVLDDLQWATKPTLLMLHHLLRAREPMQVLVLGTYRDTELDRAHPLSELLADLRRDAVDVHRVRLRGLDAEAVGAYLDAEVGQPLVRTLHENTEGNPFFIGEVLRHLAESGLVRQEAARWVANGEIADTGLPEGVKDVITRRLSRLSEQANRALAVAAVAGPAFSLAVLERVPDAGDDPDRLLDAVEEALHAGLVSETAQGTYAFAHALIRQTLYAELTSTRRARLHRRVGEAIEQAPDAEAHVESLAYHFAEAALDGQIAKAADYALAAGRRALQRLAHEEAVDQLQRGLELLELDASPDRARRADLLLELAQAHREIGDLDGNREATLAAAEDARALGSGERLARAAQTYWSAAGTGARDPTVPALVEEALAALHDSQLALRARLLARLTHYRSVAESQGSPLIGQADEALALARQSGDPETLASTLRVSIRLRYGTEHVADRLPLIAELVDVGRRHDDSRSVLTGLAFRHDAHAELANRASCDADFEELRALADELGTRLATHLVAFVESMRALLTGDFAAVPLLSDRAFAHGAARTDVHLGRISRLGLLHREQGRLDKGGEIADHFAKISWGHPTAVIWPAQLQAEAGDHEAARAVLEWASLDDFAAIPRDVLWTSELTWLAEICAHLRETHHAARLYNYLRPHQGHLITNGGMICHGPADRFQGMLAAVLGRYDEAEAHYLAALELEDRMNARPLAARTRYWYARTLLQRDATDDRHSAAELLSATVASADELGMAALASAARELRS